jgi:hypothetical protein
MMCKISVERVKYSKRCLKIMMGLSRKMILYMAY